VYAPVLGLTSHPARAASRLAAEQASRPGNPSGLQVVGRCSGFEVGLRYEMAAQTSSAIRPE
jgi:hypothetical protein